MAWELTHPAHVATRLCYGQLTNPDGFLFAFVTIPRVVAKGPNFPKYNGKLGIDGPPRPKKDMSTPCPCILIRLTLQGEAAKAASSCSVHCFRISGHGVGMTFFGLADQNIPSLP